MSISLYLYAVSKANPAIIAGIGSLCPVYASIYEHIKESCSS